MGIRFECISCGKKIVVHDRFAGRQIKCPACEFISKVPTATAVGNSGTEPSSTTKSSKASHSIDPRNEPELVPVLNLREDLPSERAEKSLPISEEAREIGAALQTIHTETEESRASTPDEPAPSRRSTRLERDPAEEEDVEWDITPMVDVAFLLLIFFMLTASFSIQKAIPTSAEPEDKPSSNSVQRERTDQPDSFIIQIDEYNAYTIISNDGGTTEATSKQDLIVQLKDLKSQLGEANPRVNIQAHTMSIHGAVVGCMDAAREAGFDSFQMQSVEEFD
jgi:biopolymer transport protein ExbD